MPDHLVLRNDIKKLIQVIIITFHLIGISKISTTQRHISQHFLSFSKNFCFLYQLVLKTSFCCSLFQASKHSSFSNTCFAVSTCYKDQLIMLFVCLCFRLQNTAISRSSNCCQSSAAAT